MIAREAAGLPPLSLMGNEPVHPVVPEPMKLADASEVVPWVSMIEPWKKWRRTKGKATPRRAEDAMRRTMKRVFAFLGEYNET